MSSLRQVWCGLATLALACSSPDPEPVPGQTEFLSAPPGASGSRAGAEDGTGATPGTTPPTTSAPATTRKVEETDLYRLEGDRLYFLNAYRGLMVFDVHDVDHPRLLGRSPIFGSPVEMIVRDGVAAVVVADWYGTREDGAPFHGSIVRGLDARDPAHIRVLGEAQLGGWVTDTRVVGDVLYAVSVDYGWSYGWELAPAGDVATGGGTTIQVPQESVIVSSVDFAGGVIRAVGREAYPGYTGVFNVTPRSILLAHEVASADPKATTATARTALLYLDISDPAGQIVPRGELTVAGRVQGWGADNGRWNLDFADGKTARVIGCAGALYGCSWNGGYVLSTADFSAPDAPVLRSELDIATPGYGVTARFAGTHLYLSPQDWTGYGQVATPFLVYDVADPAKPRLAGTTNVPGMVWNLLPASDTRIFALGNDWQAGGSGSSVSLKYLDVSNPAAPKLLGNAEFGDGWAWTPAAGTFKAFTMDAERGLVVLPFSGWSQTSQTYTNGLQLITFSADGERVAGAARTRGWVERGIFVGDRLVALSDLALSVIDYRNRDAPVVVTELTLARNLVAADPGATTIAEVASDFWDNDVSTSEVRVLPLANAEELTDDGKVVTATVDGVNARVFRNGDLAYVVTSVRVPLPCTGGGGTDPRGGGPVPGTCYQRAQQIQVVDLAGGGARLRGKVRLPGDTWSYWGWGFYGCYPWDWYGGAEVVQVGKSALAFRRWEPRYDASGTFLEENTRLYVVDLGDPDAPALASTTIVTDPNAWWGNLRVVGEVLYASHYEWEQRPGATTGTVRYFVDPIDLSDLRHPRVSAKLNVPGLLVGGSESDPAILYTIDYRYTDGGGHNDFDVVRRRGARAELLSRVPIDGWVGSTIVRGTKAYLSSQRYDQTTGAHVELHALDLANPARPVDRVATGQGGWGWLLDVEGDRAVVTSGWGASGVDLYQLVDGKAPQFRQFARTRGYYTNAVSRLGNALYLASGSWGVQRIVLE